MAKPLKTVWLKNKGLTYALQHNLDPHNPIITIYGQDVVPVREDIAALVLKARPEQFVAVKEEDAPDAVAEAKAVREAAAAVELKPNSLDPNAQQPGETLDAFAARMKAAAVSGAPAPAPEHATPESGEPGAVTPNPPSKVPDDPPTGDDGNNGPA